VATLQFSFNGRVFNAFWQRLSFGLSYHLF